ncbi:hypothetical protein RND81_03G171400 [Saponaria officinalis]|uniref:Mitochondrial glycoprotein n=1 Tax=Saponaria officinalis TaxID=3572 RepID=A0AAW1M0W1_SAPOF
MAFSTILRRSFSKAAPLATKFIGFHKNPQSSAAASTAVSALNRATISPRFAGRRFCSSSAAVVDGVSSDKKLIEVVQSEIEVAEQSEDPEKTVPAPADFPFTMEDNPGEQTVTLSREYDGETITVEVSMPNLVTGEEDEGGDEGDDEEPRTDSSVPLLVTVVKKDGNAPYLEFDCTAFPDEIRINGLSLKNPETEDHLAYEGPDFYDLDENLRKAFHKYLEIRGVKPSTTNFLHEYMIDKDSKEYIRWLKDVKTFVEA